MHAWDSSYWKRWRLKLQTAFKIYHIYYDTLPRHSMGLPGRTAAPDRPPHHPKGRNLKAVRTGSPRQGGVWVIRSPKKNLDLQGVSNGGPLVV